MCNKESRPGTTPQGHFIPVPWFLRRAFPPLMHHVEVIQRLEGEHIEQLEELIAAAAAVDGHEPVGEHKFLRIRHGDDLAVALMAYEGERLVGYAHTLTFGTDGERRVSCELVVHPDCRRSGIGRALIAKAIEHARNQGAARFDLWGYNDSAAGRALAHEFGLKPVRRLLHMHRHPGPPPVVAEPDGVAVRTFRPGEDEATWLALNNRIFAGHPEQGHWTREDLAARMAQPWFRAEDMLILESAGAPAGFCWLKVQEREGEGVMGEIYVIGVAPEYHGRGYGRYLLGEGLRHLSERGVNAVAVYVDQSNERGVALYWSFEFHHHHVDVLYSLPLAQAGEAALADAAAGT